jgi:hypothetical protein
MAAFCRQRVAFENENDAFWIREAEAQSLLLVMAFCQRLGDVFMARAGKGPRKACSYRVEEGTADAPSVRRLIGASLNVKAPVMRPDAIATGFGTEAVLRLWRIAIFRTGFPSGLD